MDAAERRAVGIRKRNSRLSTCHGDRALNRTEDQAHQRNFGSGDVHKASSQLDKGIGREMTEQLIDLFDSIILIRKYGVALKEVVDGHCYR
jgi:hypothetical protein